MPQVHNQAWRHGHFVDVVPVDTHSKIACTIPVLGAFVVFIQNAREMLNVFTADVFDAKNVNAECEGDWAKIVLPWAWRDGALAITILVQAFFEELLREDACLREAIHSF